MMMSRRKKIFGALALAVVVGAVLRFWHLGVVPLRADEFLDMNAAVGYAQTGQWVSWDHNMERVSTRINPASDARAWLYRWQVATLVRFAEPTEAVARSVSALWGVLTILVVYMVATSLTRRRAIGVIAAALFALSVSGIQMDRTLRMYAMFAPVFLMFSWMTFLALERAPRAGMLRRAWRVLGVHLGYAVAALALGVLSLHLHALTANIVFVLVGYLLAMSVVRWREGVTMRANRYVRLLVLGALFGGALALLAPQSLAALTAGIVFWEDHWSYLGHIARDYAHPLLALGLYVLGVGSLWRSRVRAQRAGAAYLDATVGMIVFAAIFLWHRNVGPQYIFFVQPFVMIGVASGIYYGARYLAAHLPGRHVFGSVVALALLLVPNYGYFLQENNTYHITSRSETPNYRKVFGYVKKRLQPGDVLVTRNFRNYYYRDAHVPVFDFGSERDADALAREGKAQKITLSYLQRIMTQHPHGWVVLADNDERFVTKEAQAYIQTHMTRVSHPRVRGPISVWRWGVSK